MRDFFRTLNIFIGLSTVAIGAASTYNVKVTEKGFEPSSIKSKPGEEVILQVTRVTDSTCATEIQVPSKNLSYELPLNNPVTVKVGKLAKGTTRFGCGMNMMVGGVISVE